MASHNWTLVRDLFLARYAGNDDEAKRLEALLLADQARCQHVPNPEHPERCYKCGWSLRPSLAKVKDAEPLRNAPMATGTGKER